MRALTFSLLSVFLLGHALLVEAVISHTQAPEGSAPMAFRFNPTEPVVVVEPGESITVTAYALDGDCDLSSYHWVYNGFATYPLPASGCELYSSWSASLDAGESASIVFVVGDMQGLQDSVGWELVAASAVRRSTWGALKALFRDK
jgi:hypothetical protein